MGSSQKHLACLLIQEISLHVYPVQTILAEKIHTTALRGATNSRISTIHQSKTRLNSTRSTKILSAQKLRRT